MTASDSLPKAWMGYKSMPGRGHPFAIRVCSWCPDKSEAEAIACRMEFPVSHWICTECYHRQMASLMPDPEPIIS